MPGVDRLPRRPLSLPRFCTGQLEQPLLMHALISPDPPWIPLGGFPLSGRLRVAVLHGPCPLRVRPAVGALLAVCAAVVLLAPPAAGQAQKFTTRAGNVALTVSNLGFVGNGFFNAAQPSCEYPLLSHVEHLYLAGLWVGARAADGTIHVSTGAQDASNLEASDALREFTNTRVIPVYIGSNSQNSENYDARALATQHIEMAFDDTTHVEASSHVQLGLEVVLRVLAWGNRYADDFVILDYSIHNISPNELRDVYIGFWSDTTVGNTTRNNPYDSQPPVPWNFYDDVNGALGAEEWVGPEHSVAYDPGIWMSWEHDDDGDDGLATSWIGNRLLGTLPAVEPPEGQPPVSYNAWRFRGVPAEDDVYTDQDGSHAGKYQFMSNGDFDVGMVGNENFTVPSDWVSLLSTGPFPYLAPNDSINVTFAIVCGPDSLGLLANSRVAQVAYDQGFTLPTGPPSPRLAFEYAENTIVLKWQTGDSVAVVGPDSVVTLPNDDARRSPEYHISSITGKPDFQGYRIYRYQGQNFTGDPYAQATLVAEFDKVDGVGFDAGLPPLDEQGRRIFRDTNLLNGFPYRYAVTSFSAPDLEEGLPSFESGFNENVTLVHPGPAPSTADARKPVGVYPNPYRAGSRFDAGGSVPELGRRIWFTNLPERCRIQVYNLAGDLVQTLHHDDPVSGQEPWNLLSGPGRAIATGLYIYVVEDLNTGDVQRGKLVIIK